MSWTITVNEDGTVQNWLTAIEFAEKNGVKVGQVRQAIQRGNLYAIHVGPKRQGVILIPEDAKFHYKYKSRKGERG